MSRKSRLRKNGRLKKGIIELINKEFKLKIPPNYPVVTHQKSFLDCGGFKWYLCGGNPEYDIFGGCSTLKETLSHKGEYSFCIEDASVEIII